LNPKLAMNIKPNMNIKPEKTPSVFILNLSYTGLGIARSFVGTGIRVYGLGSKKWICGNYSRHVNFYYSPDSLTEPEKLYKFLLVLAKKEPQKPVIFPTRDHDIIFLNNYREKLAPYFTIALPVKDTLDIVLDKWKLSEAASKCNVLIPKTYLVNGENELRKLSPKIEYPVIMKPLRAADWRKDKIWEIIKRKAIFAPSEKTLLEEYNKFKHLHPPVLVQEYIEGEDDDIYTFCSYCDTDSNILVSFNTRKRVQKPEKFGTGIVVQSALNHEITECSKRLLKFIRFTGISEIEYKRDPATGIYYMIEINPRCWDQHRLSRSFGINLPLIAYHDLIGQSTYVSPFKFQRTTWIAEDTFIQYFANALLTDREKLINTLSKLNGSLNYAIWSKDDPLPFLISMATMTIDTSKRVIQRMLS